MTPASKEYCEDPHGSGRFGYRPDIDGLRAVAVLAVLFYHLGFPVFGGGFVGVDVFFVISGFLITRLIREECLGTGTFSFRNFYVRRVRRLVPAQLFVLALCTAWAAFALAPPHLESYGGALSSTVVSSSNIWFWSESGYFNAESSLKPLLHTWSLAVEEQFYLVWPAALVLALRSRRPGMAPILLVLAGATSLALNEVFADGLVAAAGRVGLGLPPWVTVAEWSSDGPATLFFLLPFRVFEFAIGGLLVWLTDFRLRSQPLLDACVASGLGLIAYAVVAFDEATPFPSFAALVPCLGAALCIYAGQARRAGALLRNPPAVSIGLASYSLYLVHWPLIVFWRYSRTDGLELPERWAIAAISVAGALVMLRWVERPFRQPSGRRDSTGSSPAKSSPLPWLAAAAAGLFAVGVGMWTEEGWAWRFAGTIVAEEIKFKSDELRIYVWEKARAIQVPFAGGSGSKMLVVGDSMAADFVNVAFAAGLDEEFEIRSIPVRDSCDSILPLSGEEYDLYKLKASCPEQHRVAAEDPNWKQADLVVVAFLWNDVVFKLLRQQMAELRALAPGATFVLVGPKAQEVSGLDLLTRIAQADPPPKLIGYRTPLPGIQLLVAKMVKELAAETGATYLDLTDLFCSAGGCLRFNEFGNSLFFDEMHLTPKGAEFLGRLLRSRMEEYAFLSVRTER